MAPDAYCAGRVQALRLVGLVKTAAAPDETAVGKAFAKGKKLIPKTMGGKGAATGTLIGLGLGLRALTQGRSMASDPDPPYIHRGSALTYSS